MLLALIAAAAAASAPPSRLAAAAVAVAPTDLCTASLGKVVQPTSFDLVAQRLAKLPRSKSEYETQAAFKARQDAALAPGDAALVIGKTLDRSFIHYDAEHQRLNVSLLAIDNLNVGYAEVFGSGTPLEGEVAYGPFHNVDVVVAEREGPTGAYAGHNGFGAHARVTEITRVTKAIFARAAESDDDYLFPVLDGELTIASLDLEPAEAQRLKASLSAAIVVTPRSPFYATGAKDWGAATVDDPRKVIQHIQVIIGDIRCGLLLDAAHKVMAILQME